MPSAWKPHIIVMRIAEPSTIAASITWPWPERPDSTSAARDAERHEHPAAAEVADDVDRRRGLRARAAEVRERAAERDVVDVVAGGLRVRAVLAPAGHAAVDELRVAGEADVGPDAEPLGHAGPEALDERVGLLDEREHGLDAVGRLEVDADRAPAPVQDLEVRLRRVAADGAGAVDPDDLGAHVRQHHRGERARARSRRSR